MDDNYKSRIGEGGRILVIRIKPEGDILGSMNKVLEEKKITAGVIISGVGLLRKACLRNNMSLPKEYPITDDNRFYFKIEKTLEILSLTGNISEVEGKTRIHAHITLSYVEDNQINLLGGHLIEGCIIFGFAEIIIMELKDIDMRKEFDEETKALQLFVK